MNRVILPEVTRQRELDAWRLRQEGQTQEQIADALGISQQAVSKILRRVDERSRAELDRQVCELRAEQSEAFSLLEAEALASWEASRLDPSKRLPHGDPRFLNAAILARTARGRLFGLDAPRIVSIEPPKTEPEVDLQAQQLLHSDPELQALSLQRARRELELRQRASEADKNRSRGVWANLEQN